MARRAQIQSGLENGKVKKLIVRKGCSLCLQIPSEPQKLHSFHSGEISKNSRSNVPVSKPQQAKTATEVDKGKVQKHLDRPFTVGGKDSVLCNQASTCERNEVEKGSTCHAGDTAHLRKRNSRTRCRRKDHCAAHAIQAECTLGLTSSPIRTINCQRRPSSFLVQVGAK